MKSPATKTDRRSHRTRRLLAQAFTELLREKGYDQITVQDIIDRADVGRSTFYAHYQDKEDLLVSELEALFDDVNEHASLDGFNDPRGTPVVQLFRHVQDHQYLYKALVWSKNIEPLFRKGERMLTGKFEQFLTASDTYQISPAVPLPASATYLSGALITLLRWWLDNNLPYPPDKLDDLYHTLGMPGRWRVLGNTH